MPFGYTDYGSYRVPDYTGGSTGPLRAGGGTVTGNGAASSFDWQGATAAIAGSLISGFFESRNQSAQIASNARQQESSARYASYMQDVDRYNQNQDRRWIEEGMAAYRPLYAGSRSAPAPVLTDPGTRPVDPYTRPRG